MSRTTHLIKGFATLGRLLMLAVLIMFFASCNKSTKNEAEKPSGNTSQMTFASQEEAGAALFEAAKSGDQQKLLVIFGPDSHDVLFTGDAVQDKNNQAAFLDAYSQMHRWGRIKVGGDVLFIGPDNYPFPIPLGRNKDGRWYFDTAAGKDEILARRIGNGELNAMATLQILAEAQHQYYSQPHDGSTVKQYAQKLVSDEGKHDGLYWPVKEGEPPSPLGPAVDFAKALGYGNSDGKPQPFAGYYFRILTKQGDGAKGGAKDYVVDGKMTGGFAILAYPARYRDSGIMTFIMDQDGVLYQKDLGEHTQDEGSSIVSYNPGDGWNAVGGGANANPTQAETDSPGIHRASRAAEPAS